MECKHNVGPFFEQLCKSTPQPSTIVPSFVKLQKISSLLLNQFKGPGLRQFLHVNTSLTCSVFSIMYIVNCILCMLYEFIYHFSLSVRLSGLMKVCWSYLPLRAFSWNGLRRPKAMQKNNHFLRFKYITQPLFSCNRVIRNGEGKVIC